MLMLTCHRWVCSGNTEFMLSDNSFLIPVEGLEPVREGAFQGHLWARPSVDGCVKMQSGSYVKRIACASPASSSLQAGTAAVRPACALWSCPGPLSGQERQELGVLVKVRAG